MKWFTKPSRYYNELGRVSLRIWREVHENGDLTKLCLSGKPDPVEIEKAWHKLNNEFLQSYGLDKSTKDVMKLRFRLAKAMVDYISTGNKSYNMEVKLLKEDINAQNNKAGKRVKFIEVISSVEQTLGFQINEDTTTVDKFYSYIKQIKKQSQKQQEHLKSLKNGKKNIK